MVKQKHSPQTKLPMQTMDSGVTIEMMFVDTWKQLSDLLTN